MAIFDKIEFSVMVDGAVVSEYDRPEDQDDSDEDGDSAAGPVIEKYIESQADQNFVIRLHLRKSFKFEDCNALLCKVYVDGELKGTLTAERDGMKCYADGACQLRKFRFSKLTPDDTCGQKDLANLDKIRCLGDIKIQVDRVNANKACGNPQNYDALSASKFSEKSTKGRAIDDCTTLDAPLPARSDNKWMCDRVDTEALVTFVFRYRSIGVLQQLGVVKKPLSERSLEDKDPDSLTLEEVRELVRRQREIIQQQENTEKLMKKRLRQEQARHNLRTLDAIKRARSLSPRERSGDVDDEEVQVVKRAKKDRKIEIVELD